MGDRASNSDVPHLPAGPPSRKAPRLRTGTPRRRSGLRLRRNGPTRPCPSSRSWRSARRSRAEPSRRRVSDPAESEERAKRRTTLAAVRVCAALRTVTARQTLPKIFRRRSLLPSGKPNLAGVSHISQADPLFLSATTTKPGLVWSSHRSPPAARAPVRVDSRSPRHDHAHLHARGGTSRASADAPARRVASPRRARETGRTQKGRCRPRASRWRTRRGPRETDRDHASFPRARLSLQPPRDASMCAVASRRARPRLHATRADPSSLPTRAPTSADAKRFFSSSPRRPRRSRRTAHPTTAGCRSTATFTTSRA